jgi:hypothetical protein
MANMQPIGADNRFMIGTSTLPSGSDLFICIGHGGYEEAKGSWTQVPAGSMVCFYNNHEKTLTNKEVEQMICAPFGNSTVPVKSIAGGLAEVWNFRVFPFPKEQFNVVTGYEDAWLEAMTAQGHPTNDLLIMATGSSVYVKDPPVLYLSDVFALMSGRNYTRYHWCACRSVIQSPSSWGFW